MTASHCGGHSEKTTKIANLSPPHLLVQRISSIEYAASNQINSKTFILIESFAEGVGFNVLHMDILKPANGSTH